MNDSPATRTLTYRELADALGVSLRAAEARARRRVRQGDWRPFKGNDGIARFVIPIPDLQPARTPTQRATHSLTQGDTVGATQGDTHPDASAVASLNLAELAERVGRAEAERDSARAERQRVEADLREARGLVDRQAKELADLRELVGQVEAERDVMRAERQRVEAEWGQARAELVEMHGRLGRIEAERNQAKMDLTTWSAGSPVARAIRAFLYRRP